MRNLHPSKPSFFLLAIAISMGLWLVVQTISQPTSRETFDSELRYINLDETQFQITGDKVVRVSVVGEAPQFALDSILPEQRERLRAVVDLSRAREGVGEYPVIILDAPEGISWSARPNSVELTIEAVEVIQSRVEVDLSGTPPNNLIVGSVRAEPEIVRLAGPAAELAKVQRVRALFDQSQIKPGVAQIAIVEVLTAGNQALPSVRVIPETVELFAVAVPDVRRKRVPINVRWAGQLPFGLEIESFTVSPTDADIRGEPEVLADIGVILTDPVDLSDVTANTTKTVRLSVPQRVTLGGNQRTATVRIQVRKAAQPAPPPVENGDSGNQNQNAN